MRRAVDALLQELLQYFPCVAIVGPRQCGKTTLLRTLPSGWRRFDLERVSDFDLVAGDPDGFLRLHPERVAIDEAQLLPGLFPALRVAIDERRDQSGRFVITGSSSPDLQRDLAESLAGRVGLIEMSPLSLAEVEGTSGALLPLLEGRALPEASPVTAERLTLLNEYWYQGGYPEPWLKTARRFRSLWRENYVKTYLERDLARLFPGIDAPRFRSFLGLLASVSGTVVNMSDLGRALAVSQPTVRDYMDIAHGTFVWRRLYPFDKNVTKRLVKHPYGYFRDSGLLHHLLHIPSQEALRTHIAAGRSWQAMVTEQILRALESSGTPHQAYFYRTAAGAEVDLVLEGDFGLVPIEIKYGSSVRAQELRPIRDFMKEHSCRIGLVVHNGADITRYGESLSGVPLLLL